MDNQTRHLLANWVYWAANPSHSISPKSLILLGRNQHPKDLIAKAIGEKMGRSLASFPLHVPTDGEIMGMKSCVVVLKEAIPEDDPVRPFYDAMTIKLPSIFKQVDGQLGTNLGIFGLHQIPLIIMAKDEREIPEDVRKYYSVTVNAELAPSYYLGRTISDNVDQIVRDLRTDQERYGGRIEVRNL